jgi:uncharacterized protein (DUF302 family)
VRAREFSVIAYQIATPFKKALPAVREAFHASELSISGEMDLSARIRRQLGLGLGDCRILLVDSPYLLVEALALDRSAAALFPLHVVVSARGSVTDVQWIDIAQFRQGSLPPAAEGPLAKLQAELERVLDTVGRKLKDWPAYAS